MSSSWQKCWDQVSVTIVTCTYLSSRWTIATTGTGVNAAERNADAKKM